VLEIAFLQKPLVPGAQIVTKVVGHMGARLIPEDYVILVQVANVFSMHPVDHPHLLVVMEVVTEPRLVPLVQLIAVRVVMQTFGGLALFLVAQAHNSTNVELREVARSPLVPPGGKLKMGMWQQMEI